MKIKAPTFADLFAETSPQLGVCQKNKVPGDFRTASFLGRT
ncbi:MAG: hypothetical protein ACLVAP_12205 [Parasutterella sp.]